MRRPIQRMKTGSTLRILNEKRFEVIWSDDDWATKHTTVSRSLGSAGHSADITPGLERNGLQWTLYWTEQKGWLGYNVDVKVEPE